MSGPSGMMSATTAWEPAAATRGFSAAEFDTRLGRCHDLMAETGLDALFLTTEPEVRYFSGFSTRFWESPARPWFLVVPESGKPVAVIPEIGRAVMAKTWIEDIRTWPSPRPADEGVSLVVETLREIVGDRGRVGVPMGPETTLRMPLNDYLRLRASLPGVQFGDATSVIKSLRMVKSEAEIAKIAHVCGMASDAFSALPENASPGQPLRDVVQSFKIDLLQRGVDDVAYLAGAAAPGGYDNVISPPDERSLAEGDVLMVDVGGVWDGYFCDFDRNFAIGGVSPDVQRAHRTLCRAVEAGCAVAHPGATSAALFQAMAVVIEDAGYAASSVGRMGHGLGMQLTEWPSHTPDDLTPLLAGMVITLEPSLRMGPGRGLVHEENIVIRADGPHLLSRRAPEDMPQLRPGGQGNV